jgi:hypothetical protein
MRPGRTILILTLWLASLSTAFGQEFYEDGSMKLGEVSTDKKYGYETNHKTSIQVGKIQNQQAYLKALRGPNGQDVQFRRIGSCCPFDTKSSAFGKGFLDKYEVFYAGLSQPIVLYLNGYDFDDPKTPVGFTYITADKIEKPVIYPAESIKRVAFCDDKKIFSVNEILLKEKVGEFPVPELSAAYEGGPEQLIKYFADKPLTDIRTKDVVFVVTIGFAVNCSGKAGNFGIITRGKGLAETFANQVLERVNNMPQNWKPAKKDGNAVDSYQVLSFTVTRGQLDKVSYR